MYQHPRWMSSMRQHRCLATSPASPLAVRPRAKQLAPFEF